ncbi:MAG: fibronectin type III domain-containing protein [Ignavibacteria bacterium]|nr:MAG: fibronectin type III domain-containing protein [Ignavibacteria bacterium]
MTPNQLYHFRDPATNTTGSTNGLDATFTTLPDAPTTTAATSVGETGFTANWTGGAGNAPDSYTLDVATDASFTSMVSGYPLAGIVGTSSAVSGLSGGTTYYYRARAVAASGTSANSNTTSVLTVPGAPTANDPTGVGATSFTAHWTAQTGTFIDYRFDA